MYTKTDSRYTFDGQLDIPPPPYYSVIPPYHNVKKIPSPAYEEHLLTNQITNARNDHKKLFTMHKMQVLRQQYMNTRDHTNSLRDEVQRQRIRTEQTIHGTYQYLKDELKKLYLESMDYVRRTELDLTKPLDEHINHMDQNTAIIDMMTDKLSTEKTLSTSTIMEAERLNSELKPPKVRIPRYELFSEEKFIPICNTTLATLDSEITPDPQRGFQNKRTQKETTRSETKEQKPSYKHTNDSIDESSILDGSISESESDISSIVPTEPSPDIERDKKLKKKKESQSIGDTFKEFQQIYETSKARGPCSRNSILGGKQNSYIMSEALRAYKQKFDAFLDHDFGWGTYDDKVKDMMKNGKPRLILRIDDLRSFDPELAATFQRTPSEFLPAFELALGERITRLDPSYFEDNVDAEAHIAIEGNLGGAYHVTPRQLLSNFLGRLVCVEGIVTKSSLILPKVVRTVHYCPTTNKHHKRDYRDATSIGSGIPTGSTLPTRDPHGNALETEYGLCKYKDTQSLSIQEMPERAPAGQLPRSVECILEDDIVDRVKPGDRIRLFGIYRAVSNAAIGQSMSGTMRTVLVVNNIIPITTQITNANITDRNRSQIERIARTHQGTNLLTYLSRSVAPSIFGHDNIKKALLLLLLGGVEKNFYNSNTHVRGDLNIMMVGDPSTAKSQLLRFMMHVAPLAISTTGRASTGVGLTAAITSDKDTGERGLQAGAMVLADRGVVCIDEFDKMNDIDRVAMHEVMEQQTVTIAKAGVHTSLNARCSVIAAANPIYGQYNRQATIQRNVGLPDSLLSRFDLVFILLDERDAAKDRMVAGHVLGHHRQRTRYDEMHSGDLLSNDIMNVMNIDANDVNGEEEEEKEDFETDPNAPISIKLLRKYIAHAKFTFKPKLTEEARASIEKFYLELRQNNNQKTLPITPRTIETLIRLSTAMAKVYLRNEVLESDVEEVYELMKYAICFMNNTSNKEALDAATAATQANGRKIKKKKGTKKDRSSAREENQTKNVVGEKRKRSDTDLDVEQSQQKPNTQEEEQIATNENSVPDDDVDDDILITNEIPEEDEQIEEEENEVVTEVTKEVSTKILGFVKKIVKEGRSDSFKVEKLRALCREADITMGQLDFMLQQLSEESRVSIDGDEVYVI
ncbi:DNA replication licensing factor MCM3 [Acrasis kona]|uniref:DNA helicase n=1 Tax=Acrasis kona TaxID=1008807 RepID=A0AAW2ZJY4_9EUKA